MNPVERSVAVRVIGQQAVDLIEARAAFLNANEELLRRDEEATKTSVPPEKPNLTLVPETPKT